MGEKKNKRILASATLCALLFSWGQTQAGTLADTVYHNGKIYTITETEEQAKDVKNAQTVEVVATKDGKVLFTGSNSAAKEEGYLDPTQVGEIIDLRGKTMLPGFIDGHGHFPGESAIDLYQVNLNSPPLGNITTMQELIDALKVKVNAPGDWVIGANYDDSLLAEKRHPNRDDLDQVSVDKYVIVKHSSGHMSSVNSKCIATIMADGEIVSEEVDGVTKYKFRKISTGAEIEGVVIEEKDGQPRLTGRLLEPPAMSLVTSPSLSAIENLRTVMRASQVYSAAGVTTADEGASVLLMTKHQQSLKANDLAIRVILHPLTNAYAAIGNLNHVALGWTGASFVNPGAPGPNTPAIGDDLTFWNMQAGVPLGEDAKVGLEENFLLFGAWKQFVDGSNQGYTGYFKYPGYWDKGEYEGWDPQSNQATEDGSLLGLTGSVVLKRDVLINTMDLYHKFGQSVETHVNGAWAAEDYMTAIELAVANHPDVLDTRHTAIHGQMQERQIIERAVGKYDELDTTKDMYYNCSGVNGPAGEEIYDSGYTPATLRTALDNGDLIKAQNLMSSFFINHTYFWGDRHLSTFMGPGRGKQMNPQGWAAAYGLRFTSHNDTPVTPISPLRSLQSSVTRTSTGGQLLSGSSKDLSAKTQYPEVKDGELKSFWDFDQRINILQALHSVTINPAYQNKIEDKLGSIAPGKLADFVILDEDPFVVADKAPLTLADMRVAATIVGDKPVYGVLPGADVFASSPAASYWQASSSTLVAVTNSTMLANGDVDKDYPPLAKGENRYGTHSFEATITGGTVATFQMTILGNGSPASAFSLRKLLSSTESVPYDLVTAQAVSGGKFWIEALDEPGKALSQDQVLTMDQPYTVFFTIEDNSDFDLNSEVGKFADPVTLVTTGSLPDNGIESSDGGGGGGGCTVGSKPAYDFLILLLGLLGALGFRSLRRRGMI
jgi:predicted amidohydrolase YtcJ